MDEPGIRIIDIAWVRLRSPDLDRQEEFLTDFGLKRSARTENALYMRGTDPEHHVHITELGDPKVVALGYRAASLEDLEKLSAGIPGASAVEDLDEPGGGKRVRLREYNGFPIEVVWGVEQSDPLPVQVNRLNSGSDKFARQGELLRVTPRPSQVKRIGHAVLSTPEVENTVRWWNRHLGIVRSDDVHADDDPTKLLASFNRVDRGANFVDHHVMMFGINKKVGLNHVAFEVQDIDDIMIGQEYLQRKYADQHLWGMGRHTLGSQVFDYWKDPWGRLHEHWTDSDMLNHDHEYRVLPRSQGLKSQWGPQAPQEFREAASE